MSNLVGTIDSNNVGYPVANSTSTCVALYNELIDGSEAVEILTPIGDSVCVAWWNNACEIWTDAKNEAGTRALYFEYYPANGLITEIKETPNFNCT